MLLRRERRSYDRRMRLLERDPPLAVLADRARAAGAGNGGVVLVAGEGGIGRTVLLRAFADRTTAVPALWGMCDSLSTPRPLGREHARRGGFPADLVVEVASEFGPATATA